jgi:hypothetical protein
MEHCPSVPSRRSGCFPAHEFSALLHRARHNSLTWRFCIALGDSANGRRPLRLHLPAPGIYRHPARSASRPAGLSHRPHELRPLQQGLGWIWALQAGLPHLPVLQEGQVRPHRQWQALQARQVRLGPQRHALSRRYVPRWALCAVPDSTPTLPHTASVLRRRLL